MKVYTCSFIFAGENVLLLRKAKPAWQAGLLNGIGGKVEEGETVMEATKRELREETAGVIDDVEPLIYHAMLWPDYESHTDWPLVYFSAAETTKELLYNSLMETAGTAEPCVIVKHNKLALYHDLMPNLPFLIEMAKCLVLCTTKERKLRQPIVLTPGVYDFLIKGGAIENAANYVE